MKSFSENTKILKKHDIDHLLFDKGKAQKILLFKEFAENI